MSDTNLILERARMACAEKIKTKLEQETLEYANDRSEYRKNEQEITELESAIDADEGKIAQLEEEIKQKQAEANSAIKQAMAEKLGEEVIQEIRDGLDPSIEQAHLELETYKERISQNTSKLDALKNSQDELLQQEPQRPKKAHNMLFKTEIPKKTMDTVWEYVETERERKYNRENYIRQAEYDAKKILDLIIDGILTSNTRTDTYTRTFHKGAIDMDTFIANAYLQDEYIKAFGETFNSAAVSEEVKKKMNEFKLIYEIDGKEFIIWNRGNKLEKNEKPNEIIEGLTDKGKLAVSEAIDDWAIRSNQLQEQLKESGEGYEKLVAESIIDKASAENERITQERIAKKAEEATHEIASIDNRLQAIKDKEYVLDRVNSVITEYEKAQQGQEAALKSLSAHNTKLNELNKEK